MNFFITSRAVQLHFTFHNNGFRGGTENIIDSDQLD